MNIHNVEFIKSAASAGDFITGDEPQVAVAGRSNVGKSSLINRLFNRKSLARVSGTPGATRLVNYFLVDGAFYFTDLPGYGYAKRSKSERNEWRRLIASYLDETVSLRAMLVLIDLRRGPEVEEWQLLEAMTDANIGAIAVLTKADKLAKSKRRLAASKIAKGFKDLSVRTVTFSSKTAEGKEALWKEITRCVSPSS